MTSLSRTTGGATAKMRQDELVKGKGIMEHAILQILQRKPTRGTHSEDDVTIKAAEKRARAIVRRMWATSTIDQRKRLWSRFAKWTTDKNLPMDANSAVLFVTATGAKLQSLLNYAKALSGIMKHIGMENQPLRSFQMALRADGAAIPANPQIAGNSDPEGSPGGVGPDTGTEGAMIAWKTMSRWGEVAALSSANFIQSDPLTVIIRLGPDTKGKEGKSIHGIKVRGDHRKMDGGDKPGYQKVGVLRSSDKSRHSEAHRALEKGFSHGSIQCSQHKTWCRKVHFREEATRVGHPTDTDKSISETRDGKPTDIRDNAKIRRVDQGAGSFTTYSPSNTTSVAPRTARRLMQNFTRKSKTTRPLQLTRRRRHLFMSRKWGPSMLKK